MKQLSNILKDVTILELSGSNDFTVNNIQYDSRKVLPGDLFVAIKGEAFDGHDFIEAAVERGAQAVVYETAGSEIPVHAVRVSNTRKALALMAGALFDHPGKSMELIGITGTNGKTSTAYLIDNILRQGGKEAGLLGTISYRSGTETCPAKWTTPDALELHHHLSLMRENGMNVCIMEVSSHALDQCRIEGLDIKLAVFTNLSQDHLDYHRSMEYYAEAKQRLFQQVDSQKGENIINRDDPVGHSMAEQNHRPVLFYSVEKGKADVFPASVHYTRDGIQAGLNTPAGNVLIDTKLVGQHNLYNIMAAVCAGIAMKIPTATIEQGISATPIVPGRLEPVSAGQPFKVMVDYAHTPDAMENVIDAVRPLVKGRLFVVFGCGGDRDRGKRPLMGAIGEEKTDRAILTSDNPRTEDPQQIIDDVLTGIRNREKVEVIPDRTEAIHAALDSAESDDWILLLGKGHETYQVLGTRKIDYDDRAVAYDHLKKRYQN
ncbi:UDP-N-acetylmuramoyl-L-alanyl-D-glutamate--2,6-diaminopimelate ligase [candidate division KSB1 bacterium]